MTSGWFGRGANDWGLGLLLDFPEDGEGRWMLRLRLGNCVQEARRGEMRQTRLSKGFRMRARRWLRLGSCASEVRWGEMGRTWLSEGFRLRSRLGMRLRLRLCPRFRLRLGSRAWEVRLGLKRQIGFRKGVRRVPSPGLRLRLDGLWLGDACRLRLLSGRSGRSWLGNWPRLRRLPSDRCGLGDRLGGLPSDGSQGLGIKEDARLRGGTGVPSNQASIGQVAGSKGGPDDGSSREGPLLEVSVSRPRLRGDGGQRSGGDGCSGGGGRQSPDGRRGGLLDDGTLDWQRGGLVVDGVDGRGADDEVPVHFVALLGPRSDGI